MISPHIQWQIQSSPEIPSWLIAEIRRYAPNLGGGYAAQLLWQRGICDRTQLAGFLKPEAYQPASPFAFGEEMQLAVARLQLARQQGEKVFIWGDFDADGITATAVLWEGLGQFFPQGQQLFYTIPNRLTESHGLNCTGIEAIAAQHGKLIVTCDTGSTNIKEIIYAQELGIDVIVTDHHSLPVERPAVAAIINPRYLPAEHQLYHLSGVAVAYKLIEALYLTFPEIPQHPLENLLDLVAIGLIADLVQLTGDCRYLAQKGIAQLQKQSAQHRAKLKNQSFFRPGVAKLLELCQKSGDRPTDISFGLGPRINAVSRIQGDASFCVELLTSRNEKHCEQLAYQTELANVRRKSLQKDVAEQVKEKLSQLDLATTSVIVLVDSQWPGGVLGLVAGQVAQEYGRPTILLSTGDFSQRSEVAPEVDADELTFENPSNSKERSLINQNQNLQPLLARGSARSFNQIDLYQLVKNQAHLLNSFGGHPLAAGLSILVENIPIFVEAINADLRRLMVGINLLPTIQADLTVTVAELSRELFQELKLLEPCGMGNPAPKLLIKDCWFENISNYNIKDFKGRKIQYIKTNFEICDNSTRKGFPGIWWGHYKEEIPPGRCDAIVELDYNNYSQRTEARLIAVRSSDRQIEFTSPPQLDWILDWRTVNYNRADIADALILVEECPTNWGEVQMWFRKAIQSQQKLAIAYPPTATIKPEAIWQQLVGIAKYLSRTGETATWEQLQQKLKIGDRTLDLGIETLKSIGFAMEISAAEDPTQQILQVKNYNFSLQNTAEATQLVTDFLAAVQEEQFLKTYFYQVPLATLQSMAAY